jgi:hypothetical protein
MKKGMQAQSVLSYLMLVIFNLGRVPLLLREMRLLLQLMAIFWFGLTQRKL